MKKKIYQIYRKELTEADIKEGIKKCFNNASQMLDEAIRYKKNKKYNFAYYFSYTTEEEFIKIYLLFYYFSIVRTEGIRKFWRYFTNHEAKKRLTLLKRYLSDNENKTLLENIYFIINEKHFQNIRKNSFYCDVISPKQFILPQEIFEDVDVAETIKKLRQQRKEWQPLINDDRRLKFAIQYIKENSRDYVSPNEIFKKTHGKYLIDE